MKKYLLLFLSSIFCFQFSFAQPKTVLTTKVNPVAQGDKSSLSEQVFTLQKDKKELQQQIAEMKSQLSALQTQVNANYKLLDYSFGKLSTDTKSQFSILQTQVKSAPVAFTVVAGAANLVDEFKPATNYSGKYYGSVIIDNAACNGNRDAIVVATLQSSTGGYNLPTGIAVRYDTKIAMWKIVINPHETNPQIMGEAKPLSGSLMVSVAEYHPYNINYGDKFNVIVMK